MATGDKIVSVRPRADVNERFDLVDFLALSATAQAFTEAMQRSLISSPRATAGAPTGERWTGSMTANPTGASDGLFRLDSAVFVGLDSNGSLILKPSGTALSVAIPAGGTSQQVYAYMVDASENPQVRRFIPATTPFTEFTQAINVALRQTCNLFVRAGTAGSVVAEDVVAAATRPLLFLGICVNTAGSVVFTPAANMLETVTAPVTTPATNLGTTTAKTTVTGGQASLRELVNAALYGLGQLGWKGSRNTAPVAGNNFQAYAVPPLRGVDALFDSLGESVITPITAWRDWNLNRRALIDHNGYRMGQVTEVDALWKSTSKSVRLSLAGANRSSSSVAGGGWESSVDGALVFNANGQLFNIPFPFDESTTLLDATVFYNKTVAGDAFTLAINTQATTIPSLAGAASVVVNTGTGNASVALTTVNPGAFLLHRNVGDTAAYQFSLSSGAHAGTSKILHIALTFITDSEGWSFTTAEPRSASLANCLRTFIEPQVGLNQNAVNLKAFGRANGGSGIMTTRAYETFMNADLLFTQEWMVRTGTISDGTNNRVFAIGVQNNNGGAGDRFVYLYNENTTANWQLRVVGSSTVDTNTGVAIAANTTYRMRLEIAGSNVSAAGAGNFRVRAYINGVLVADVIATTMPTADMIRPYLRCGTTTTATSGPYDYSVGRLRRVWNHLLNGDNL